MRAAFLTSLCIVAAAAPSARADGLIYQLPVDGAQIRYDIELTISVAGQDLDLKGSVVVSSVGQTTVENEKCRWIEFKMIMNADGQERITITKALIPEAHIGKGKSPMEHLVRAWAKEGEGEAQEVKDFKSPQATLLRAFLAAPPKNVAELANVEIDGKLGKLECPGITGDGEFDVENSTIGIHYENRLHEKAPFGVVSAVWKFDIKNNGQVAIAGTLKFIPTDSNTTALSDLPDKK